MQHQMLKSEYMKSIKKLIVMYAAGGLALLTAACGGSVADAEQQVPTVNVATLHAVSDAAKLQYPGRVKAAEEINLAFKVSGRIERILVKEGDYVKAGQLVALIDPSDYETQLQPPVPSTRRSPPRATVIWRKKRSRLQAVLSPA